jgi:hypothetical protein
MVAPTRFGITLPSSGSIPSAFWQMQNWGAVDGILWMGVLCLVNWCVAISDLMYDAAHAKFHQDTLGSLKMALLQCRNMQEQDWYSRYMVYFENAFLCLSFIIILKCMVQATKKKKQQYTIHNSQLHIHLATKPSPGCIIYRVIHKSLRDFQPLRYSSRDGHAEGERVNRGRDTARFCPTLPVLNSSFCCVCLGCWAAKSVSSRGIMNYPPFNAPPKKKNKYIKNFKSAAHNIFYYVSCCPNSLQ